MSDLVSGLVTAACRESLAAWFEGWCTIKLKGGAFTEGMPMHSYQRKLFEVQDWCKTNKKPCRIIGLKPRRGGSSTFSVASMYHFLQWNPGRTGCVMGGSDFQGENLFAMLKLMAKEDRIAKTRAQVLDKNARFANGSTAVRINASNENAGLSGGYDFLVVTELSKFAQDGVAAAPEVLAGALKCVPFLPDTTIIIESTADGRGNEYERMYSEAITFEELKAGKVGYVRVFSPWFEFTDHTLDPSTMGIATLDDCSTAERDQIAEFRLSLSQIAWMRYTLKDQCKGDMDDFRENYPCDESSCFLFSGRHAFSPHGIDRMKRDSAKFPYVMGNLDFAVGSKDQAVIWRPAAPDNCRILRWEQPRDGMKYLISVDSMTGASQTVGVDPDNHFVTVWRAGYFERGEWFAHRVVAHLVDDWEGWMQTRKFELKWDIGVLEAQVWRLALYFGNCLIVPEMNKDRGLVELLKLRGSANIYLRTQFNRREQKEVNAYGWVTTNETRGLLVTALQTGIREYANVDPVRGWSQERCEIYSPLILDEAETFIVKSDGRCEAMSGKHDDSIASAGIGLVCINGATTYHRPAGQGRQFYDEPDVPQNQKVGTWS